MSKRARVIGGALADVPRTSRFAMARTKGTAFAPVEYKPAVAEEAWFCACKRSEKKPMCDGSHKKL
jgi:CDGSH-type Zn-finger protein